MTRAMPPLPKVPFRLDPSHVDLYLHVHPLKRALSFFRDLFGLEPLPDPREVTAPIEAFLDQLQGNILSPHGRDHSVLLFFHHTGTASQFRDFIKEAEQRVTTALKQYQDARHKDQKPYEPFVSIALTRDGIAAAGCRFPKENDVAFRQGMFHRRGGLRDDDWVMKELADQDRNTVIHGAWLLANKCPRRLRKMETDIRTIGDGRVTIALVERGVILRNQERHPVEPFGFRDGISMPEFFVGDKPTEDLINMPLESVLSNANPEERGGSFLVFRKLQQNVAQFRQFEGLLAEAARVGGALDPDDAARWLVGRSRDGTPLVELDQDATTPTGLDLNRFDYSGDEDERRCPFHAHIRKAFPRSMRKKVTDRAYDHELAAQIVRRGLVYGTDGQTLYDPEAPPPESTGLLFLAYMADISDQFEFMQATWLGQPDSPAAPKNQQDPLLYGGTKGATKWYWSGLNNQKLDLPSLVTTLGGAYFFVPPIQWLRNPPKAG